MKKRGIFIGLAAFTPLLSGCIPIFESHYCPAFDNSPGKQWQPVEPGNSIVLTNADGESAVYLLQSVNSTGPYYETVDITSEARKCQMTSTHVFIAEDGSHEIALNFSQLDIIDIDPAEQFSSLSIEASLPEPVLGEPGEQISRTLSANFLNPSMPFENLRNPSMQVDTIIMEPRFFTSRTLENDQTYTDVIEFPGISNSPNPVYEQYSFNAVMLSRNVGLIQISRNDGQVYSVVSE